MVAKHRERKLPVRQLAILSICRFAEPLASTSLYPYLPEMLESFQIPQNQIGKWAGLCAAVFSLCQASLGIPWGRFSDRYGRKPAILLGLTSAMFTSLLWGFCKNLPMAIIVRALAGMGNGNVGIIRTTVAEMVPFKELQPRAFSLMPLVWNIGSIFGPSIGGALANPFGVAPGEHRKNPSLLEMFPYALPNIVSACFFTIGITIGVLFLEETLETARDRKDYGLIAGQKLSNFVTSFVVHVGEALHIRHRQKELHTNRETDPLLKGKQVNDQEHGTALEMKPTVAPPAWSEVLNKQAVLNLVAYTLLAMHSMAFDQVIPVFMQHSPIWDSNPDHGSTPYSPPLKFAGGFGLDHFQIGLMSTGYGIVGMVIQFLLFPPLARRYGVLFWLKLVAIGFPIVYFITPFTALLPTTKAQVVCMFVLMFFKCICVIFAFPCSTILLTNSASGLRTLGTLNGFATTFSAIGRAAGPAMTGAMMTVGLKSGYVIAPWWFLTAVGIISVIPIFWLVEGEGFGGDDEVSDEEEDEEGVLEAAAIEGQAEQAGKPSLLTPPHLEDEVEYHEERTYGGFAPLSRTTTQASTTLLSDDEAAFVGPASRTRSRRASGAARTETQDLEAPPTLGRKGSSKVVRKVSKPIGMGNQGISRRYSSNLGQSLGNSGGQQ